MGKGCKVLLVVGIVLFALIAGMFILSYVYCDKIQEATANKTVEEVEKNVLDKLPEGVNYDEVKATLAELRDTVKTLGSEKRLKFDQLLPIMNEYGEAMKDKALSQEEVSKILEKVRAFIKDHS